MRKPNQLGFRHLAFEVEDIDPVVEKLRIMGIEAVGKVVANEKTGKRFMYFYGPDNILLELAQFPRGV